VTLFRWSISSRLPVSNRPNLLIAATVVDAGQIKRDFRQFSSWYVMTPRNAAETGWFVGSYTWTPEAQNLPAKVRWELRQRLVLVTDEDSTEEDFPTQVLAW